jgi:hypothetical protein
MTALPTTSTNNVTGTWSPALDNTMTMTYTFTPDASQCANTTSMTVVVNPAVPAPTVDTQKTFIGGKTVNDIMVQKDPNGTVEWYASEADALAGKNELAQSTVLQAGNYYAMQTINGCTSAAPFMVTVTAAELGLDQFEMDGLRYYPNPVKKELNVSYNHEISSIELFNFLGQYIMTVHPNALDTKVDMTDLPIGTYLMQVSSQGKSAIIKIIKTNN